MACRPLWAAPDLRRRATAGSPSRPAVAAGIHRPQAGSYQEAAPDSHHPEAEEEADTHRVEAEEAGSYQGAVAGDRTWTPSSDELAGNERAHPNLRDSR